MWYVCDRLIYHVSHLIHFVRFSLHHRCIQPWLIKSVKQGPGPCDLDLQWSQQISGSAFWISLQTDWSIKQYFLTGQYNHGRYSNPTTQLGAQNKDFGPGSQTDLTSYSDSFVCGTGFFVIDHNISNISVERK